MQTQPNAGLQQLQRYETYLASDPDNGSLLDSVVQLCLAEGQPQRAESHVRAALARKDGDPYLRSMLGHTLLAQQQWEPATELFGALLLQYPDGGLAYNFALGCLWLGRWQEGWQALLPYVETSGAEPAAAAVTLALRLLHRLGELERAGLLVQRFRDAQGQDAAFLGAASAVCLDNGDLEQAAALSEASLAHGRTVEALVVAGSVALARTEVDVAVPLFQEALATSGNEARAWAGLGMASMLRKDLVAAQIQLEKAVHYMPGHIGTWHLLAWARLYGGYLAGATSAFQTALDLDRNFGESHGGMAVVQAMAGQRAAAEASIARALGLDSESLSARYAQMLLDGDLHDADRFRTLAMRLLFSRAGTFGRSLGEIVQSYQG
jgi:tetratricopeptide (TPR) repeat protein